MQLCTIARVYNLPNAPLLPIPAEPRHPRAARRKHGGEKRAARRRRRDRRRATFRTRSAHTTGDPMRHLYYNHDVPRELNRKRSGVAGLRPRARVERRKKERRRFERERVRRGDEEAVSGLWSGRIIPRRHVLHVYTYLYSTRRYVYVL